jgi:hypothetical protein
MSGNKHEGIQTATTANGERAVSLQQALPWPEGKSGAQDGQRQMGAENSILLCRGSNALRRVRWKRGKLRPCVAYHEIWLEVDEQRPNGARDGRVGDGGLQL